MRKNQLFILVLFLILAGFIILEILISKGESLTWDESGHYAEGIAALTENNFTISPNSPTFIPQLSALPLVFGLERISQNYPYPSDRLIFSRLVIIIFTALLGIGIFFFTKALFDKSCALLALVLFLFEPLVLANGHYITLDMGFSLFFFLAYWLFIQFLQRPGYFLAILVSFTLGLMFSAKATGIGFFILTAVFLFLPLRKKMIKLLKIRYLLLSLLFIFIGIWFTYRFTFGTLGGFTQGGSRLSNKVYTRLLSYNPQMARIFRKVLSLPLPLGDFPRIAKNALVFNQYNKTSFFLGQTRETTGPLFILLFLLKTPIPLLIFLFLGLGIMPKKKIFFIVSIPVLAIFSFVFLSRLDLRLRYLLPLYPFIAIISAYGFRKSYQRFKTFRLPLLLIFVWFILEVVISFPHPLSYANEISTLLGKPYLIFSDSNIDWGQGLIALRKYTQKNHIGAVNLSYYGIDDPNEYGFTGFLKGNLCKMGCTIDKTFPNYQLRDNQITALAITNWQDCGWYKTKEFSNGKIKEVIGGSLLIFQ